MYYFITYLSTIQVRLDGFGPSFFIVSYGKNTITVLLYTIVPVIPL